MEDVNLYGNQDTLFTAPLPLKEREEHGFRGPRENAPRLDTVQYYKNCTIRGNIDSVSYTHLDVYKRQVLSLPLTASAALSSRAAICCSAS